MTKTLVQRLNEMADNGPGAYVSADIREAARELEKRFDDEPTAKRAEQKLFGESE